MREAVLSMRHIVFVPTNQEIALLAADIIRQDRLKLRNVDAIHLATAALAGAGEFWTNDRALQRIKVKDLRVKMLEEYHE